MGRKMIEINYVQLRTMYKIQEKPLAEIAKYFGVSVSKIVTELHRTGILDNDIHTTKEQHCKTCKYRVKAGIDLACNYICIEKKNRGCDARHCFRYEKGDAIKERGYTDGLYIKYFGQ